MITTRNILRFTLYCLIVHASTLLATLPTPPAPFHQHAFELALYKKLGIELTVKSDWIDELNALLANIGLPSKLPASDNNSLFTAYPALRTQIPYINLAALPTPLLHLSKISQKYGTVLYLKNDAVAGGVDTQGLPDYGGNKRRKGGFIFGHALSLGADTIIAPGCAGSNYAIAIASMARSLGMHPICMLTRQPPSLHVQHNLLLHLHYGSELHYSASPAIRALHTITLWLDQYKNTGTAPYLTPTGGSNIWGTLGFVDGAFELAQQIKQGLMPMPTHIYVATGTYSTAAGLLLGCKAAGITAQIVAVAVEHNNAMAQKIDTLFHATNEFLHSKDPSFPLCSYNDNDLRIERGFTGPGYGILTQEGMNAADEMAKEEAIILEGTYTGKACACLLNDIQHNPTITALFWNTYSGLDFSHMLANADYTKLPLALHDYFQESNLQPLELNRVHESH